MKFNSKYQAFWNDSRYTILTGGRGSGKSYFTGVYLLALTLEVGHVILYTRYTLRAASVSIIPEFKEKIEILNIGSMYHINID